MKTKVKPIPDGYHTATPYLIIRGAAAALEFYKKAFGAKVKVRMPGPDGKVGHAEIQIGDSRIMLADEFPQMNAYGPEKYGGSAVSLMLYVKNVDAVVKRAVAAGAKAIRPIENKFYGDRMGSLEDPFGHLWHVATHVEDVPVKELKKRAAAMCGGGKE